MASLYFSTALQVAAVGSRVVLLGEDAKHAVTVARTRVGERLSIGNGRGLVVHGTVSSVESGELTLEVESVRDEPLPTPELWLVQALAKGDRDELAVQAATELGASGVIPFSASRSVSRWDAAKAQKGRVRWEAIVREASKQSIRAWVPEVEPVASAAAIGALESVLVLDPTATVALTEVDLPAAGRIHLVVGPEGGIDEKEFAVLGGTRVRLGAEVLRTSTAGPAALAVLNARLGRW
jgi:16S rRNA (uracil1498-N3)-methyltransferase